MIRKGYIEEQRTHMRDGSGTVTIKHWMEDEQLPPHLRLAATLMLPVGASIGEHVHEGEAEVFHFLQGEGEYEKNGEKHSVQAGDVTVCYVGDSHSIKNTGNEDLVLVAVIVTEK